MGQSYPIYACTRANHARCSSVQLIFCGSWIFGEKIKNWQVESVKHIEQYHIKFCGKSHNLKRRGRKAFLGRCFRGHNLYHRVTDLCTPSPISFFPFHNFF